MMITVGSLFPALHTCKFLFYVSTYVSDPRVFSPFRNALPTYISLCTAVYGSF